MSDHSPEPWTWQVISDMGFILAADGTQILEGEYVERYVDGNDPNILRIIACVNACAGIPDDKIHEKAGPPPRPEPVPTPESPRLSE